MSPRRAILLALVALLLAPALAPIPNAAAQGTGNPFTCTLLGAHGLPSSNLGQLVRATGFGDWYMAGNQEPNNPGVGVAYRSITGTTWTPEYVNFGAQIAQITNIGYGDNIGAGSIGRLWFWGGSYSYGHGGGQWGYEDAPASWSLNGNYIDGYYGNQRDIAYSHQQQTMVEVDWNTFSYDGYYEAFDVVGSSTTWSKWASADVGNGPGNDIAGVAFASGSGEWLDFFGSDSSGYGVFSTYKSSTGASWTSVNSPPVAQPTAIAANATRFVIIGQGQANDAYYTDDTGTTWHQATGLNADAWTQLAYASDGGAWLAVANNGDANRFAWSRNGATWTQFSPPISDTWTEAAYAPDLNAVLILGATYAVSCQGPPPQAPTLTATYQNECTIAVLTWSGSSAPYTLQVATTNNGWQNVLTNTTATQYVLDPLTVYQQYRVLGTTAQGPSPPSATLTINPVNGLAGSCGSLYGGSLASTANALFGSSGAAAQAATQLLWAAIIILVSAAVFALSLGRPTRKPGIMGAAGAALGLIICQSLSMIPLWADFALLIAAGAAAALYVRGKGAGA
jgi:hypothetical protein